MERQKSSQPYQESATVATTRRLGLVYNFLWAIMGERKYQIAFGARIAVVTFCGKLQIELTYKRSFTNKQISI